MWEVISISGARSQIMGVDGDICVLDYVGLFHGMYYASCRRVRANRVQSTCMKVKKCQNVAGINVSNSCVATSSTLSLIARRCSAMHCQRINWWIRARHTGPLLKYLLRDRYRRFLHFFLPPLHFFFTEGRKLYGSRIHPVSFRRGL